jgi:hypothetical protein
VRQLGAVATARHFRLILQNDNSTQLTCRENHRRFFDITIS